MMFVTPSSSLTANMMNLYLFGTPTYFAFTVMVAVCFYEFGVSHGVGFRYGFYIDY